MNKKTNTQLWLCLIMLISVSLADDTTTKSPTTQTTTNSSSLLTKIENASSSNTNAENQCNLKKSSKKEQELLDIVNKFKGRNLTWEDDEHKYYISICSKSSEGTGPADAFIQENKKSHAKVVVGRLTDVDLEGTNSWIRMTYNDGDRYPNACNRTLRTAVMYFLCSGDDKESVRMVEENNEREQGCAYIFEFHTPVMCEQSKSTKTSNAPTQTSTKMSSTSSTKSDKTSDDSKSKWGLFSLIFVVIISFSIVYLAVGTAYLRFVRKERGFNQIPNWTLWNMIGNRSADCCNLVCRCGQQQSEIHSYENINDRVSDDENLLNM